MVPQVLFVIALLSLPVDCIEGHSLSAGGPGASSALNACGVSLKRKEEDGDFQGTSL
ncbi:hypothetical protein JOC77_000367 [Peribacillus deserti]|uniref:Uncharacterized protein n=1 Tax=Peribacillus deserti TaxID=673318 RepID=A0ABS2QE45_9BACI|nr:hypothetical protein [Peribacillus deserti]